MLMHTLDVPPLVADREPSLRDTAGRITESLPSGYRVEILGGSILVFPPPSAKHGDIIRRIDRALNPQLSDGIDCYQLVSIGHSDEHGDYAIPDLVVMPINAAQEDDWLIDPNEIELAVEVVSKGNAARDIQLKPRVYAAMGVPIYLLIDPRNGSVVCYSDPRDNAYQAVHHMEFGAVVDLPEPMKGIQVDTASLPRYV